MARSADLKAEQTVNRFYPEVDDDDDDDDKVRLILKIEMSTKI